MKLEIFSTWSELIINNLTRSDLHSEVTCRVNNNNISASINIMLHLDINCKFIMKILVMVNNGSFCVIKLVLLICKNATEEKLLFVKISDDLFKMKCFFFVKFYSTKASFRLVIFDMVGKQQVFLGRGAVGGYIPCLPGFIFV